MRLLGWSTAARDGFGAENDSIAVSLRRGRGFADPFITPTGPTAWMPPAMPVVLAAMYGVLGDDRDAVALAFWGFQLAVYAALGTSLVLFAYRNHGKPIRMAILYTTGICAMHFPIFQFTHGHPFEVIAVTFVWVALSRLGHPTLGRSIGSGLTLGVAAMAFPAASIAGSILMAWQLRRHSFWFCNAVLALLVTISPWVGRNYAKFGTVYPIKSNAAYELWQSLNLSQNGLVDADVLKHHPFFLHSEQHNHYVRLGEQKYLLEKAVEAKRLLRSDLGRWIRHSMNRCRAALLWQQPWYPGQPTWALSIGRLWKLSVLASLLIVLWRRRVIDPSAVIAAAMMMLILAPYILISYYERYAWSLFPLQVIVVFYALSCSEQVLIGRGREKRKRSPECKLFWEVRVGKWSRQVCQGWLNFHTVPGNTVPGNMEVFDAAPDSRQEPYELDVRVRIYAGGGWQQPSLPRSKKTWFLGPPYASVG